MFRAYALESRAPYSMDTLDRVQEQDDSIHIALYMCGFQFWFYTLHTNVLFVDCISFLDSVFSLQLQQDANINVADKM